VFFIGADDDQENSTTEEMNQENYLTVQSLGAYTGLGTSNDSTVTSNNELGRTLDREEQEEPTNPPLQRRPSVFVRPFIEMTPPQIAKWIDIRSRWIFPLLFLAINIVYWITVIV